MTKPFTLKEFKEIYSKVPRLCVDLVIKTNDGILLTKRSIPPKFGYWHFPGGTVFHGKTLEETVKRISKEELGVDVTIIGFLSPIEFVDSRDDAAGHTVSMAFLVKIKKGHIKLNNEASDFGFFKKIPAKTLKHHIELIKKLDR